MSSAVPEQIRVDIDLSALPIGKHAEGAKKGYVAKKQNTYTRQLARLVCGETQEIFSNQLYPGDTAVMLFSRRCLANLRLFDA